MSKCIKKLTLKSDDKNVTVTILIGGFDKKNPKEFMDRVVEKYTKNKGPYNEFIENNIDLPWVRVIIHNINDGKYSYYNPNIK